MPAPRRKTTKTTKNGSSATHAIPEASRAERIAVAAYFLAEKRGFEGTPEDAYRDWVEAEAQIAAAESAHGGAQPV
jgi:hypothetical protein